VAAAGTFKASVGSDVTGVARPELQANVCFLVRAGRPVRAMGTGVEVECPYCGETVSVVVDEGGGTSQQYVEDCPVCCRPIELSVRRDGSGEHDVEARREDD
jgi:Cysteine-rich CPXCG